MNTLREAVHEYLAMRRSLGFKLHDAESILLDFVNFFECRGALHITVRLVLAWVEQLDSVKPVTRVQRLCYVRCFARYRHATDARTEIPPIRLLSPCRARRPQPYIYSAEEIRRLLDAALNLPPKDSLWPRTFYCLLGLLCVTGLRIGEARELRLDDVDLDSAVLTIRGAKFGKSRFVPLDVSSQTVLADYRQRRERFLAGQPAPHFFVNNRAKPLSATTVHTTFYALSRQIGLRGPTASHGPRLHDIRHRFAHETLLQWYRAGLDTERRLHLLSTFLGHVKVADTYWYLSAWPELMTEAMKRLEQRWGEPS